MITAIKRNEVFPGVQEMVTETCASCGLLFAFPKGYERNRRADHGDFYCPNGHTLMYGGKTADEIRADTAERHSRNLEEALTETQDALNEKKRELTTTKGKLTKAKNRADAGVCQHCNRTFTNVARHVAHMHADPSGTVESHGA